MNKLFSVTLLALVASLSAFAQVNTLTATTISAAQTRGSRTIALTSATGVVAPTVSTPGTQLYVYDFGQLKGEIENVLAISGTTATVSRTASATVAHASGAVVMVGQPNWYYKSDPTGSCVTANTYVAPYINTESGEQFLCSTITLTWIPGFGNRRNSAAGGNQVNLLIASAAGATAINSPLLHVTGTNAITSFTMGAGWHGEGFCTIPDAAYTVTATNNILKAATAVATRTLCFTWDATNSGFTPSY